MLGKQCVALLWGPRTWQRMEEGDKEVVFLACLHRVPRNAGTGNAWRLSAVSWMPERQIWKVALGVPKSRKEQEEEPWFFCLLWDCSGKCSGVGYRKVV